MALGELTDNLIDILKKAVVEWEQKGLSIEQIEEREKQVASEYYNMIVQDQISFFTKKMNNISKEQRKKTKDFVAHNYQIWGKCFAHSEVLYEMACEAYELYREYVQNRLSEEEAIIKQYTYVALAHLHGRCCQIYLEILFLLRFGFADGAYARWRTMFDIYCTASFINKSGERIARQYVEKMSDDDLSAKNKLSWTRGYATDGNGKDKVLTKDAEIQSNCDIEKEWIREYKTSNFAVHASPLGTFGRISSNGDGIMPAGHSDKGISLAGEHSAIFLDRMTQLLLIVYPNNDANVYTKIIHVWTGKVVDTYEAAEKKYFNDTQTAVEEDNE